MCAVNVVEERAWSSIIVPLPARGIKVHVRRWGREDPRFVFIHGFGGGSFVWEHVIPALLPHESAVAIDLRGHGQSDHDPSGCYSTHHLVEDVLATLDAVCARPVHIVGHSLGGELAMYVAATAISRVRGIVLVDGGPELDVRAMMYMRDEFLRQPWRYPTLNDFVRHLEIKLPLAQRSLLKAIAPLALIRESGGGYRLRCDRAIAELRDHAEPEMMWSLYRSIECPVFVIRGMASALLTRDAAERMTRELPQCCLETLPLAGHAVMLDNPSGLVEALSRYFGWA